MYRIQMNEAVTTSLNGPAVHPDNHPITLNKDNNWIGYPLSYGLSVSEAFAGANPVNGDMVSSLLNSSMFYNGTWYGELQTLEPGQGYLYQSKASGTKTFTFPSNPQK